MTPGRVVLSPVPLPDRRQTAGLHDLGATFPSASFRAWI